MDRRSFSSVRKSDLAGMTEVASCSKAELLLVLSPGTSVGLPGSPASS
jgi:hypothetical protein